MTTENPSKEIKVSYLKELRRSEVHFSIGTVKSFMKIRRKHETTEHTEK
jgi:hypothetical protein